MYNYPTKNIKVIKIDIYSKTNTVAYLITGKKNIKKVADFLKTIKNAKD